MCAIVGAVLKDVDLKKASIANEIVNEICESSMQRGRDGRGWLVLQEPIKHDTIPYVRHGLETHRDYLWKTRRFFDDTSSVTSMIGNMRAEPTTEFVREKQESDQQPYRSGTWAIVHNGTIANDKEIRALSEDPHPTRIDSAAIVELLARDHMSRMSWDNVSKYFVEQMLQLKGSYAILAMHVDHPGKVLVACNYRPVWYAAHSSGVYFASSADYFPDDLAPQRLPSYSMWAFEPDSKTCLFERMPKNRKALVVCSGGLDSVVAAATMIDNGYTVELVHFLYGSRAQEREVEAVQAVGKALDVKVNLFPMPIYKPEDSPLLQSDSKIAGGEEGAEFAHEWVPARNLVMLSIATALAEAGGFGTVVLGNNLEEAGAYPDNEPEFINRFNETLEYAVADGKQVQVKMPVGNLMKHEIVGLGHALGAPLDKTWSCYRNGPVHCGTCGPCFMRKTAFTINGLPEVISYANEE